MPQHVVFIFHQLAVNPSPLELVHSDLDDVARAEKEAIRKAFSISSAVFSFVVPAGKTTPALQAWMILMFALLTIQLLTRVFVMIASFTSFFKKRQAATQILSIVPVMVLYTFSPRLSYRTPLCGYTPQT
jgi:hypothetical protein